VAIPRRRERSAPNAPQASLPPAQPAKTTLFAGGNKATVRKMAAGHFSDELAGKICRHDPVSWL
jgi:hypothetical protein